MAIKSIPAVSLLVFLLTGPFTVDSDRPILVRGAGLVLPESVIHDEQADVYLVSNFGSLHPQKMDNNGFISRLAPDGRVLDLKWVEGGRNGATLHAPKGMTIVENILYVADIDHIRLFRLSDGEPLGGIDIWPDDDIQPYFPYYRGHFLNDLCSGRDGTIYFTDSGVDMTPFLRIIPNGTDALYRLDGEVAVPLAQGPELEEPNGCVVVGANVFVVTFGSNEILRVGRSGRVTRSELFDGSDPVSLLDGIVRIPGGLAVTSWNRFGVYRTSRSGKAVKPVLRGLVTPADLGFDRHRRRLLIPLGFASAILIEPLE